MIERSKAIAAAYRDACRLELAALKPGNVHARSAGHGMTVADFERSAEVSAPHIAAAGLPVGDRIRRAVEATVDAVGCNTNLGIVLLCVPLAVAAERGSLASLPAVLGGLTVGDAEQAYSAISRAAPGGLGSADAHDVADRPGVTLLAAMAAAADRDRIARQYVDGFGDVRGVGFDVLTAVRQRWRDRCDAAEWSAAAVYLAFLAAFPDSHIVRKQGPAAASEVRAEAQALASPVAASPDPSRWEGQLMLFDSSLKARGINPGTTADLTVATLFAYALAESPDCKEFPAHS